MGDASGPGRPALSGVLQDRVTTSPPPVLRRRLASSLFPSSDPRLGRVETLAVLLAAFVVCLLRLPAEIAFDTVWAEDGSVFLASARADPFPAAVLRDYAGYLHVAPRLAASLVALLPLEYAAIGLALAAAAVQATSALVGYVVVRAHRGARVGALLVAAAVTAVPVGPEVVLTIANMQWFLLFGGLLVQLWAPSDGAGRALQLGLGLLLVLSCPFGFLAVGVVVVRAALRRTAFDVASAAALTVALVVQLAVIASAGEDRVTSAVNRGALGAGFVRRVLGDGVLGIGPTPVGQVNASVTAGLLLLAGFAVLLVVSVARHGAGRQVPVLAILLLAYLAYATPVVLTGLPALDLVLAGRYFVAPALLWVTAFALVLPTSGRSRTSVLAGGLVVAAFGALLVTGWVSSWAAPQQLRAGAARWSASAELARERCGATGPTASVLVPLAPPGFTVDLPCRAVGAGGAAGR